MRFPFHVRQASTPNFGSVCEINGGRAKNKKEKKKKRKAGIVKSDSKRKVLGMAIRGEGAPQLHMLLRFAALLEMQVLVSTALGLFFRVILTIELNEFLSFFFFMGFGYQLLSFAPFVYLGFPWDYYL